MTGIVLSWQYGDRCEPTSFYLFATMVLQGLARPRLIDQKLLHVSDEPMSRTSCAPLQVNVFDSIPECVEGWLNLALLHETRTFLCQVFWAVPSKTWVSWLLSVVL